ncbi:hypothetical protein [Aureispira anguillae]|nr:hypothetical protein [Aureispira anguillae]
MASSDLGIDFFGVGALARNVWYVSNNEQPRGTKDVDFAVYIPNTERYNELKTKLIEKYSYKKISTNQFCLMSPYGIPLDLLPFGKIETLDNEVTLKEGKGLISINLDGFLEVYFNGLITTEIEGDKVKVCSIPSVVLLKLIAYDDRPENRPKDPLDIDSIIQHYPNIEMELIWTQYTFLYEEDEEHLTSYKIGIKVLGYEISKIIIKSSELTTRIIHILNKAIELKSDLAQQMIQDTENETVEQKTTILKLLKTGIEEGLKNYCE